MERGIEVLIQYAQADFSQRIYLFLQFPDLRDAFQEIECMLLSCTLNFPTLGCTAVQREMFWASIVSEPNRRDMAIEKI
jgi:hypothetical protein